MLALDIPISRLGVSSTFICLFNLINLHHTIPLVFYLGQRESTTVL